MNNTATVLVVDDDADIRELTKMFLEAEGYNVLVATDGLDALEQLQGGARPTVILLDMMMPRMDGEQFLKRMRSTRFAKTPVVVMSGFNSAQEKADELHAAYCLMKPVEFDELFDMVRRLAPIRSKNGAA